MTSQEHQAHLIDRLGTFYHSEYVGKNQPWVRQTPFDAWLKREMFKRGYIIHA
jgi:hypothetical protein